MTQQQKTLLAIVIIVVALGGVLYFVNNKSSQISPSEDTIIPSGNLSSSIDEVVIQNTISGTKTMNATVKFMTPGGENTMYVLLGLNPDQTINAVDFSEDVHHEQSRQMYESFKRSFDTSSVLGKKIDEVSLSRVGGASLSTRAFMQALSDIDRAVAAEHATENTEL